ncbi:MAG: hypothetical protein J6A83_01680 [Clostridia bacterium]|nr:hypothetical protein [Clostridia bacterium]
MRTNFKIKLVALILVLTAILSSCNKENGNDDTATTASSMATTQAQTVDTAYESIPRFDSESNNKVEFSFVGDPYALSINIPAEWETVTSSEGYSVRRDGNEIGKIFSGEPSDAAEWTEVKCYESADGGLLTTTYIERRGAGESAEYRYRFCYSYAFGTTERLTTVTVALSELDEFAEKSMAFAGTVLRLGTDSGIGILSDSSVRNIAILGNSFVGSGSSNIGAITQEMFERNGKQCNVDAISRGMANISTYTDDSEMMAKIRSGYYDIVFICGLYSNGQVGSLKTLKDACDVGQTRLVVFPAHNENTQAIEQAKNLLPELVCLNWKSEIDYLIESKKISRWDFCYDDYYDHSKPLAGYVGAHMIYRAIYSSVPTVGVSSSIQQSYVDSLLGDYSATGVIELPYKASVKYLY